MQQFLDAWMNAWRSFGAQPNGAAFQIPSMPQMPDLAQITAGFPQIPGFPGMPDFSKLAAGALPGLSIPTAAIPPERLQKLQTDYSREAMELIQQATTSAIKAPELKDRRLARTPGARRRPTRSPPRGIC